MYFRVKHTGSYAYLQLVESFRQKGRVQQRVLSTVGRLDVLQASGQLDCPLGSVRAGRRQLRSLPRPKYLRELLRQQCRFLKWNIDF